MKKWFLSLLIFHITMFYLAAQISPAEDLLNESIKYHDPDGNWKSFEGAMYFLQPRPEKSDTTLRIVFLNLKEEVFHLHQQGDHYSIDRMLEQENCTNKFNGSESYDETIKEKYGLNCDRARMYKNYYSYLYGLPMKLKDPGTIILPQVIETVFQGIRCNAIKVTYDPDVGEDVWYFYFDLNNSKLIGYRFYHDEEQNDGEYITLSGEVEIGGINMPKDRSWYYNKDDKFLGIDILLTEKPRNY